jgi:hypothetical protein
LSHRFLNLLVLIAFAGLPALALSSGSLPEDWRSQYQTGKLNTRYVHYSVIAEGVGGRTIKKFGGVVGSSFLGMKVWASSTEEAAHMVRLFANHAGFSLKGVFEVYVTAPSEPPGAEPHGYSIKFTRYDSSMK